MPTLSDFEVPLLSGDRFPLAEAQGRVVLVVNVASQCGFTPQYAGLEQLWRTYRDQGLMILGCPCDQFGHQEPGSEIEIAAFCSTRYDVTFPMTAKLAVNGPDAHPLWSWLQREKRGVLGIGAIKWNYTKFLVGRNGQVVARYAPTMTPDAIAPDIERALAHVTGVAGAV